MAFFTDFKKFAFKGNVVDLAVGVVIGGAFGRIVSALVADVVMPVVALLMPTGDWRENGIVLREAPNIKEQVILKYGDLLGAMLDFFIISIVLFLVVSKVIRAAERALADPQDLAPTTKTCEFCLETVPIKASRCKACTSQLQSVSAGSATGQ